MTSPTAGVVAPARTPPPKRLIRNYLLNPKFQLKYAGLIVLVAVLLMAGLGVVIWTTAQTAARQAQSASQQAERATRESQTSSRIMRMDQLMGAADNPELVHAIEAQLADVDRQAEQNLAQVREQRIQIERNRKVTLYTLFGTGFILVLVLGLVGIVITHKVVGPVVKMKRLLRQVGTGRLNITERLRKGDELEDLFDTFLAMTESLKKSQEVEMHKLESVVREIEAAGAAPGAAAKLRALLAEMNLALGTPESMRPPGM